MYCGKHEYHQRLKLIEGFARESGFKGLLPTAINSICLNFKDDVVYWTIHKDIISQLINNKNNKIMNQTVFQIGSMTFQLFIQNKSGNIILRLLGTFTSTKSTKSIKDFNIYFELFCIQTETQFKQTYERTNYGVYDAQWSQNHLNIQQIKANKYNKLTFAVYIKQLPLPQISNYCKYKWDLYKYLNRNSNDNNKECKLYSPNFGQNSWCLWSKNGVNNNNKNNDLICIGIQLLNLPFIYKQSNGILFKCIFEYGYGDTIYNEYEFNYYLNLDQHSVEIGSIINKPSLWVKVEIVPINTEDDESETSDDETESSDNVECECVDNDNDDDVIPPSSWTSCQDWCFRE